MRLYASWACGCQCLWRNIHWKTRPNSHYFIPWRIDASSLFNLRPPKKRSSTNLNYPQPRMWFSSVTSSTTHRQQGPPHPFSRLWSNQGIKNAWWVKAIRTVQRSNASISPWISLGVSTGKRSHLKQIAMEVTKHRCDSFATRPQAIHTDWSALSATRSHKD